MKVVNKQTDAYTVYIGRGSAFGNPFKIGQHGTRDEVIAKYEVYARSSERLRKAIQNPPPDAVLGCFCKPLACHGDVIIKLRLLQGE